MNPVPLQRPRTRSLRAGPLRAGNRRTRSLRAGPLRAGIHRATLLLAALLAVGGCARVGKPSSLPSLPPPPAGPFSVGWTEEGIASWYGNPYHGRATSSGEIYDMEAPTAAHRSLPFGTMVRVENLANGRNTTLRINDRGPFVEGRIIDVSRWGARELEMLVSGVAPVRLTIVELPEGAR